MIACLIVRVYKRVKQIIKSRLHKARPTVVPSIKIHHTSSAIKGSDAKHCYDFGVLSLFQKTQSLDRLTK
jgi:hypothetical protein